METNTTVYTSQEHPPPHHLHGDQHHSLHITGTPSSSSLTWRPTQQSTHHRNTLLLITYMETNTTVYTSQEHPPPHHLHGDQHHSLHITGTPSSSSLTWRPTLQSTHQMNTLLHITYMETDTTVYTSQEHPPPHHLHGDQHNSLHITGTPSSSSLTWRPTQQSTHHRNTLLLITYMETNTTVYTSQEHPPHHHLHGDRHHTLHIR